MSLKKVTMFTNGWKCLECGYYNEEENKFYSHRCGDCVLCRSCSHDFLIETMTIAIDPCRVLEEKKKNFKETITKLIIDFFNDNEVAPLISTEIIRNVYDARNVNIVTKIEFKEKK